MDKYTLMCSKLTPLQEEWEPKVGDKYRWNCKLCFGHPQNLRAEEFIEIVHFKNETKNDLVDGWECGCGSSDINIEQPLIWLPTLEQLIEILEGIYIFLSFNKINNEWTASNPQTTCQFNGNTHQEALLKLVAYEKWGLTWSDEKEAWEDNNAT